MKFSQVLRECYLTETTVAQLAQAIKNKNPNIYNPLQVIKVDNNTVNPMTYDETKQTLLKMGINIELDPKLDSNIKTATAQADRSREAMQQRKGYGIGQERIAQARAAGRF